MRIHKLLLSFLIVILCFCTSSFAAANDSDPVALLQSIADQMLDQLKANKATLKTNSHFVYDLTYRTVVPYADLNEMSRRVLPPATWAQASPGQRAQFQKEFTSLLVRTYASALNSYKDQTVKFYPIRGGIEGKSNVTVNSEILNSDGPSISVSYRLVKVGSRWRLYDMSVEGVSMLESFRSQFADLLSQGNMDQLLQRLAAHNSSRSS